MKKTIRKTIKNEAKSKPKQTLAISLIILISVTLILSLVAYILINLTNYNYNIKVINDLIIGLLLTIISPLVLGYSKISLDICQNKETNIKELFSQIKQTKYIKLFGTLIITLILVTWIIGLIPAVGVFINIIILIFYLPFFMILPFYYLENKNQTKKEIIFNLENIISGNRIKYYGLILSFSFWFILTILTIGILSLYVIPYLYLSLTLLYKHFTYERDFKREKAISDGNIILIFLGITILITSLLLIFVPSSKPIFNTIINGQINKTKGDEVLSYGGIEITYDSPKEYRLALATDTSKSYINDKNYNTLQYTIYLSSPEKIIEMDKEIVKELHSSGDYTKVKDEEFTLKINGKKIKGYKYLIKNKNKSSNTISIYYPKGDFVIAITLSNNNDKEFENQDIKKFITIY